MIIYFLYFLWSLSLYLVLQTTFCIVCIKETAQRELTEVKSNIF